MDELFKIVVNKTETNIFSPNVEYNHKDVERYINYNLERIQKVREYIDQTIKFLVMRINKNEINFRKNEMSKSIGDIIYSDSNVDRKYYSILKGDLNIMYDLLNKIKGENIRSSYSELERNTDEEYEEYYKQTKSTLRNLILIQFNKNYLLLGYFLRLNDSELQKFERFEYGQLFTENYISIKKESELNSLPTLTCLPIDDDGCFTNLNE
jgi:hypothetical protein